jgi:AraC family transcriptional regulator
MAMNVRTLASGPGWSVSDVNCSSGPHDPPFEEMHASVCIAAVMRGSFHYRTTQGAATLVPGAILLGNHHSSFECRHDHGTGDRCLSFMFDPGYFETILSAVPGIRKATFDLPRLPPSPALTPELASAELAWIENDPVWLEQLALRLAGKVVTAQIGTAQPPRRPNSRDERRIAASLRRIEAAASSHLTLSDLATDVTLSPYHFLRTFRAVVGMTPHQFVLRKRLQDAAVLLRRSDRPVLDIALDAGFGDLSSFNRRFRAVMGMTPSAYRRP